MEGKKNPQNPKRPHNLKLIQTILNWVSILKCNPTHNIFSEYQNYVMHILGSPNQNSQLHYHQHNLKLSNPNSFSQFSTNSTKKFQYSQADSVFPISRHFQSSVGGEPLPDFDTSLQSMLHQ